ncbi:MAG: hypothetical protein IID41_13815 [Planctomycetes bacterium]|nr:hypothetical protein [Planctomycetota bacterium]
MSDATETKRNPLHRIADCYPEISMDWESDLLSRLGQTWADKGPECMADTVEFVEAWTPGGAAG